MIKKIVKIVNTGSFHDFQPEKSLLFGKSNLIYGENGSGKSTLSTIIKSLSTNNSELISNKTTISEGKELGSPLCELNLNDFTYKFENLKWEKYNSNYNIKNILVFDDEYIEKNIFTFLESKINHARNQYRIIFGETGVKLNEEKENLVSKNKNKLKPSLETARNNFLLKYGLTVEDYKKYNSIKTEELLGEEINKIRKQIQANQANLSNKNIEFKFLEQFNLVSSDEINTLNKSLSTNIKSEAHLNAKKEVEEFKQKYFHQGTSHDNFLKYGIANVNKEGKKICPLCHNEFQEDLFDLYRNYFDKGYDNLIANLEEIKLKFVEISVNNLLVRNTENVQIYNFWKGYVKDLNEPKIEITNIGSQYNQSIKDIQTKINLKKEQTSKTNFEIENLDEVITKIKNIIQTYNDSLNKNKTKIQNYQASITTIDLAKIQKDKAQLEKELQLLKKKENIKTDIAEIDEKAEEIKKCEIDIKNLNQKIEGELSKITETFVQKINEYLENENFKVNKIDLPNNKNFSELHCEISLEFNKKPVKMYSTTKSDRINDFLSTGEKRSLGFAFFMASLENENQLKDKVLIFDDPITSLDYNRMHTVARKISYFSGQICQTFVLTHDKQFFCHLFKETEENDNVKYLKTEKVRYSSGVFEICEESKDLKFLTNKDHHYNHYLLEEFSKGKSLDNPENLLRKLFEDLLEYKFPDVSAAIKKRGRGKTLFTHSSLTEFVNTGCIKKENFDLLNGVGGQISILNFTNSNSHSSPSVNSFNITEKQNITKKALEIFRRL